MIYDFMNTAKFEDFSTEREAMVDLLKGNGIHDETVLKAMSKVPRHLFIPKASQGYAYKDHALAISCGQTISQPYIVALMTEAAQLNKQSKVLEIGTGSGYQAAILAEICKEVYTIEIIEELAGAAAILFKNLKYRNIHEKIADGHEGWLENAPFDAIIVTAAAKILPKNLLKQLIVGGCVIVPLEKGVKNAQILVKITKTSASNDYTVENLLNVSFVPMVKQCQ